MFSHGSLPCVFFHGRLTLKKSPGVLDLFFGKSSWFGVSGFHFIDSCWSVFVPLVSMVANIRFVNFVTRERTSWLGCWEKRFVIFQDLSNVFFENICDCLRCWSTPSYLPVVPGQAGGGSFKEKTISQRKNLPIECAQGDRPARCPNHFFAVPWWDVTCFDVTKLLVAWDEVMCLVVRWHGVSYCG